MRLRNVCVLSNFVAALAATWAGAAMSQDYATRPVRIVTSPAGGGSDQAGGSSRRACRRCSASR